MSTQPCRFGLIGNPLTHSASAAYFAEKFRREGLDSYSYSLYPLKSADEVRALIAGIPGLGGLNVTIPYKQSIIPLLNRVEKTAAEIGAVNTILIKRSEGHTELTGYNTDAEGFRQSLPHGFSHKHALVLGTGGSSKAVAWILGEMGVKVLFVSRLKKGRGIINYEDVTADVIQKHSFIVNCTPLGMFPETEQAPPLPYRLLGASHLAYDLIYNPAETKFLSMAADAGAKTQNGRKMFENQAELSFKIWTEGSF